MAEVKDKIVTVESLGILHEHNENTYMTKNNPTGSGVLTMDGTGEFAENVNAPTFTVNSRVILEATDDALNFIFVDATSVSEE